MSHAPFDMHRVLPEDLTIAIPCFNEVESIGRVLEGLLDAVPEAEIIVVDDGSRDGSERVIRGYAPKVRLLRHDRNRGYGASIKTACVHVGRPYLVWYDADGQHTPKMVQRILEGIAGYDCAIGARTWQSHSSWLRRPGKGVLYGIARLLTGVPIPDLNSGLRAFRTSVLKRYLHLLPDGFSASTTTTIMMLERGYRVQWIPITTRARTGKSSVRQIRDGAGVVMLILHLINMFRPLRFYLPVAAGFFLFGVVYGASRALLTGRGVPTLAAIAMVLGIHAFFFGLLADQLSAMRKERYEQPKGIEEPLPPPMHAMREEIPLSSPNENTVTHGPAKADYRATPSSGSQRKY